MKAYILINTAPGKAIEVANQMQKIEGVTQADAITGEYDVIAVVEAETVNQIGNLIVEKIQTIEGLYKTVTCLAVR